MVGQKQINVKFINLAWNPPFHLPFGHNCTIVLKVSMSTSAIIEDMKLFCQACTELWSNSNDLYSQFGHKYNTSEMELYIILVTEKTLNAGIRHFYSQIDIG